MDLGSIISALAMAGGPAILGAAIIKALWNADDVIKEESRAQLGRSSRAFWSFEFANLRFFRDLFDRVYQTGALLRPSARRFVVIGGATILIVATYWGIRYPVVFNDLAGSPLWAIGMVFFLITVNLFFDYLAAWQSRVWIAAADRASSWVTTPLVLLGSTAVSIVVFLIGWGAAIGILELMGLVAQGNLSEYFSGGFLETGELVKTLLSFLRSGPSDFIPSLDYMASVSLICSIIVNLWLWLYCSSLLIAGALRPVWPKLREILQHVDFEKTPVRANGLLSGSAIILLGVLSAGLHGLRLA